MEILIFTSVIIILIIGAVTSCSLGEAIIKITATLVAIGVVLGLLLSFLYLCYMITRTMIF